MPALYSMLSGTNYVQNYASIFGGSLQSQILSPKEIWVCVCVEYMQSSVYINNYITFLPNIQLFLPYFVYHNNSYNDTNIPDVLPTITTTNVVDTESEWSVSKNKHWYSIYKVQ